MDPNQINQICIYKSQNNKFSYIFFTKNIIYHKINDFEYSR